MNRESVNTYGSILRFITPILVTVSIFILAQVNMKMGELDNKIFQHLINDEIHVPRSQITLSGDFNMYVKMRDAQWNKLYDSLSGICEKQDEVLRLLLKKQNEMSK